MPSVTLRSSRLTLLLLPLVILSGCQDSLAPRSAPPTPTATATATVVPSLTPTFSAIPTATASPTRTPRPTPSPTPTPSGGSLAFISNRHGQFEVYVLDTDTSQLTPLTQDGLEKADLAWSINQNQIAFAGRPRGGTWQIYRSDARGGGRIALTQGPADNRQPAWSPDGRRLAFVTNRDGNWEIYLMNSDGSGLTNLTQHPASDWHPTWSPDGRRIAFATNRDGNWEIYVMDADGRNPTNLTASLAGEEYPVWSPTGRLIAFVSDSDGQRDVYVMNPDGTGRRNLTRHPGHDGYPTWSADGEHLVFASKRDGDYELYEINTDGNDLVRLTRDQADDLYPSWATPASEGMSLRPGEASGATRQDAYLPARVTSALAPEDELAYQPVTLWHFPADARIDGMRSNILYTLSQVETGLFDQDRVVFGFEPGDDYQQIYVRDTAFILPTAQYFYPAIFLYSPVEEFLYRQYESDTLSSDGDAGMRPGAGAISGMLCSGSSCVNKTTVVSDEESALVHAAYLYFKASADAAWLRNRVRGETVISRLNRAMEWLYTHRFDSEHHLLKRGHTVDWGDVKAEPGSNPSDLAPGDQWTISIYDQAMAFRAWRDLAEMNLAVGDTGAADRCVQRADELRRFSNEYLWQPQRGFYRTHLHLTPVPHPLEEDAIISIANAVAVYTGLADEKQAEVIFDHLESARQSMGAVKPGLSLYPPYPSGFFAYPQLGEGMYQNGGLWDWWGGIQITAEFQHGLAQRGLEHLAMVAADWSTRPFGLPEWQFARTGTAGGSPNYAAGAATMGEAVIAGLFGVHLDAGRVELAPRLGEHEGYIRVYQPATDLYAAYHYTWKDGVAVMEYGTNYADPIRVRILSPRNRQVTAVAVDGQEAPYTLEQFGADTYVVLVAPPSRHRVTVKF